jgi:hypothetical protein
MREYTVPIALTFVNLIPSIVLPLVFAYYKWLTNSEALIVGVLIWIAFTTVEALYITHSLRTEQKRDIALWETQNSFETRLANIRESYRRISSSKRDEADIFQSFFDERASELEHTIVEASNRGELHLNRGHVVSVNVLFDNFRGQPQDILRAVHFLEDNRFFFDMYARQYVHTVYGLVQKGKVKEVKRLMIYDNDTQLNEQESLKLMAFHAVARGFSYRTMSLNEFRTLAKDYSMVFPRDFGIYGDKYVYCAEVNKLENLVGYWLRKPDTVQQFIRFFDACWRSPVTKTIPKSDAVKDITLNQLFDPKHQI